MDAKDPFGLLERICVVTGAGSGIGQGVAVALAGEGAKLALLDVDEAGLRKTCELIEQTGGEATAVLCDVSSEAGVQSAHDTVMARYGAPHVLVNVAGIVRRGSMETLSLQDWNLAINVNLTGYFLCAQAFGRSMLARGDGAMIHFTSVMADFPSPYTGAYSVTKAGVRMLSRQLAIEWGPRGVRSNCVAPSLVLTPMSRGTYDLPGVMEARSGSVPLGRIGLPADMAQAVLFLASPRASYVNGADLMVDGGFMANLMTLVPRPGPDGKLLQASSLARRS
jgi:NAD(P)-dependent dehydrogenase (short-subunit alcohol dehydrogenase family)